MLIVVAALLGAAAAQDGWTHELHAVFPEPFSELMFPWPAEAEPRDITDCWPAGDVPFLGASKRFWCFAVNDVDAREVGSALRIAMQDAGYGLFMNAVDWLDPIVVAELMPILGKARVDRAWVFNHEGQPTLIAFAMEATPAPAPQGQPL